MTKFVKYVGAKLYGQELRNHVQLKLTILHFKNRKSLHCLFICCIYESVIKIRSVVRILPPVAENIIGVTGLLSLALEQG